VTCAEPPPARARLLERAALTLVEALERPGGTEPPPGVRRRAEALHVAVTAEHPASADLPPQAAAEHAELAGSAGAALAAVVTWALTDAADPRRPARRRAAVAAARILHDDLLVHHAHEQNQQVAPE
jgi:hypothetical protein